MSKSQTKVNVFVCLIRTVIISVIVSLLLVLLAALIIKLCGISTEHIGIINVVIKLLSIVIAVLLSFRFQSCGWLWGILMGVLCTMMSFAVFSLLSGEWNVGLSLLNDCAFGALAGMISGIIAVNIHGRG